MMQQKVNGTPVIHKRMSSLPSAYFRNSDAENDFSEETKVGLNSEQCQQMAPVLPLKVGRHLRSRSAQTYKSENNSIISSRASTLRTKTIDPGMDEYTSPTLEDLRANAPAIPKRHSGRNLVGLWLLQGNGRVGAEEPGSKLCNNLYLSDQAPDEAPSLTNFSISSDSTEQTTIPMQVDSNELYSRHNCIRELYFSEKQFSRELVAGVSTLRKITAEAGVSGAKMAILFNDLPKIVDISHGLLTLLEQLLPVCILTNRYSADERELPSHVGRAMCIFLNGEMYRAYEHYICNHGIQKKMFKRVFSTNEDFEVSVGGPRAKSLVIRALLQRPVQRIFQYPLYLSHIMEQLPANHPDLEDVAIAYRRSREYCKSIDGQLASYGK